MIVGIVLAVLLLIVVCLVAQKCLADSLTWYSRSHGTTSYSGLSVAIWCEVVKYPLLAVAISIFESPSKVLPTFRAAAIQAPLALCWVGAAYAAQNVLYFYCLDNISAAGYQVLSQTKLLFTAGLMQVMLHRRFSRQQIFALALLCFGTILTQIAETSGGHAINKGSVLLGGALTILSSMLSALPNVFYEGLLKSERQDEWTVNVQMTTWIFVWIMVGKVCTGGGDIASAFAGGWNMTETLARMTAGLTPLVWMIVLLKGLLCLIIPACLKYGDNIFMGYAKPASIVITMVATAAVTTTAPAPAMITGAAMVVASMVLYGKASSKGGS